MNSGSPNRFGSFLFRKKEMALRQLQATNNGMLAGKENFKGKLKALSQEGGKMTQLKKSISCQDFAAQVTPSSLGGLVSVQTNTDVSLQVSIKPTAAEIREMLISTEPNAKYFELLAEERRKALEETLTENKMLVEKIKAIEKENADLRVLAQEGAEYAKILQDAMDSGIGDDLGVE